MGDRSRRRFVTPADFPLNDCSPYSRVHVRRDSLGFFPRSRTIFCRPEPNPSSPIRNFCLAGCDRTCSNSFHPSSFNRGHAWICSMASIAMSAAPPWVDDTQAPPSGWVEIAKAQPIRHTQQANSAIPRLRSQDFVLLQAGMRASMRTVHENRHNTQKSDTQMFSLRLRLPDSFPDERVSVRAWVI